MSNKRSIFYSNFRIYAGTVILAVALSSLLFIYFSFNEMQATMRENRTYRMQLAADDFENQLFVMARVSYVIKITPCYRNAFIERNPYYEIELIEDFSSFQNYLSLDASYYLYNRKRNVVYGAAAKYPYAYFHRYLLCLDDDAPLYDMLQSNDRMTVRLVSHALYISIPVDINGAKYDNSLLFIVDPGALLSRLSSISGLEKSGIALGYQGERIFGRAAGESVVSAGGSVCVWYEPESDDMYVRLNAFRRTLLLLTALFALLCALAAGIAAWYSYRPIRRMLSHYNLKKSGQFDELEQIENLVDNVLDQTRLSQGMLEEQLASFEEHAVWLRQQMITLALRGEYDQQLRERMSAVGISFPHPLFCVLICQTRDNKRPGEELARIIQNMSDEEARFYPARLRGAEGYAVLMNMVSEERVFYARWMLIEASYAISLPVSVRVGAVVNEMRKTPMSFMTAFSSEVSYSENTPGEPIAEDTWFDDVELRLALACARKGDADGAVERVSRLLRAVDADNPSAIKRRLAYADVASRLVAFAGKNKTRIPDDMLGMILLSQSDSEAHRELENAARYLAEQCAHANAEGETAARQDVIRFIHDHLSDSQLNSDQIADEFGLSARQISQIVKTMKGMPYREYLISIRMSRAKSLLLETERTVGEISEDVGYANIPYFIRAFKLETGYSPGEYRKAFR